MYVAQQERPHPIPPPLSMDRVPQRTTSYPTSSSGGTMLPSIPRSPQAPPSTSTIENGRIYSLDVVQQPVRARMCGFGDKDRRPITPPPCVRLIVRDATTQKEIDINEIDTSFFVLTVDLWSAEGNREVNLVRHSATSPSISAATSSSYPPPPPTPAAYVSYPQQQLQQQPYGQTPLSYAQPIPTNHYQPNPPPPPPQAQHQHGGYYTSPMTPTGAGAYYPHHATPVGPPPLSSAQHQIMQQQQPQTAPSGMFTRNLIGSLSASAFRLTDPDNKIGVWFILQDLSVRTEGSFRLKMNFVNVGNQQGTSLNTGSAPVLASTFSDVFQVFSAKKFPGVIESTSLSKCFATQGIKIPIRKDGPKALSNREEYDNDD